MGQRLTRQIINNDPVDIAPRRRGVDELLDVSLRSALLASRLA